MAFEEEFGIEIPDDAAEHIDGGRRGEVHREGEGRLIRRQARRPSVAVSI